MPLLKAWINVETRARTIMNAGPITNFTYFRVRRRMNKAGEFRLVVPATDPRIVDTLAIERTVQAWAIIDDTPTWIGGGVIQSQRWRKNGDGPPSLEVSGPDLFGELTRGTVGVLDLDDADGGNNLDDVLATLPAYWNDAKTGSTGDFSARFVHETPLNALIQVAEKLDAVFRYEFDSGTGRNLEWYNTLPTTPVVRLVSHGDATRITQNENVALITDIQEVEDSRQIVNTVYVYGAGNGEARISADQVDDSVHLWPDDTNTLDSGTYSGSYGTEFEWDDVNKALVENNSVTKYGARAQAVQFNEVGPVSNTDADFDAAMNTLIKQTVRWMERRCDTSKTYTVECVNLLKTVLPGDIVTVDARYYRDGETAININNQDLTVLDTETLIDQDGARITGMTLAERRKYPLTDGEIVASSAARSMSYQHLPQLTQYTDTITYREPVTDAEYATLHFWLAEEVAFVDRVMLRFKVTPFDSMMGYYSGGDGNTAYTFTANATISVDDNTTLATSSQSTNATATDGAHTHEVSVPAGTITNAVGFDGSNNLVNADASAHTFDTTDEDSDHFHNMPHSHNVADHAHDLTQTAHRHTVPWGYVREDGADTYAAGDLEFQVNGAGSWVNGAQALDEDGGSISGWYDLDITQYVRQTLTRRPLSGYHNYVTARAETATGKTCQIQAQIACTVRGQPLASIVSPT